MATQTGSIDLRGANSAKLYVDDEAGEIRTEVSETYATKTEVRRTDTGSGTVVSSDDAANLPPLSLAIHGKSVQDGTPSPSNPVEIRSVAPKNLLSNSDTVLSSTYGSSSNYNCVLTEDIPSGTYITISVHVEAKNLEWPNASSASNRRIGIEIFQPPNGTASGTQYVGVWYGASTDQHMGDNVTYSGRIARTVQTTREFKAGRTAGIYIQNISGGSVTLSEPCLEIGHGDYGYTPTDAIGVRTAGFNLFSNPRNYLFTSDAGALYATNVGSWVADPINVNSEELTVAIFDTGGYAGSFSFACYGDDGSYVGATYLVSQNFTFANITSTPYAASVELPSGTRTVRPRGYDGTAGYNIKAALICIQQGTRAIDAYVAPEASTPIHLDGHALRSLPDGTEDTLAIDGEGNATLTQRIGITTTATTDGISATVGTDAMSTTGDLSDGATVIYKLASEQTISLGKIDLPSLPSPSFSLHVDASVSPTIDAEWWTQGGEEVGSVYQRTSALEQDVDGLTLELSEKVDSSEEWVSWLHAGTDATTHEPYLAMGQDSDYPSVVYGSDAARFYDGEGDAAANVVASFGAEGVVVGKDGSANTTITDSDITFHDADGNEAGKISMSSAGAVPTSATYTITTSSTGTVSDTITGITPLPDFTLGYLVLRGKVNSAGTGLARFESWSDVASPVTMSTSTIDYTFKATPNGDTWGIEITATNRSGTTASQTVEYTLEWYYSGSAPQYKFGTGENAGAYSFLAGLGLETAKPAQVVLGSYNEPSQTDLFIVGNGTSDGNRSNALWIDENDVLHVNGFEQHYGSVTLAQSALWGWLQALGLAIDEQGTLTRNTTNCTSLGTSWCRRHGTTCTVSIIDAAIRNALANNGNVVIATVPAWFRPPANVYAQCFGADGLCTMRITATGEVRLSNRSGSQLAAGHMVAATLTYVI